MPLNFGQAFDTRSIQDAEGMRREFERWIASEYGLRSLRGGDYDYPDGVTVVGYQHGLLPAAVAGFTLHQDDICDLRYLYVRQAFRGNGDGRRLLAFTIDLAEQWGYRWMRLTTSPKLTTALRLFESCGFTPIAPAEPDAISMERALTPRFAEGIQVLEPVIVEGVVVGHKEPGIYERTRSHRE
jgi:GNAT superfamily N-acetyltransferase